MLEAAWRINKSFNEAALTICSLAEHAANLESAAAAQFLPQIREARELLGRLRGSLVEIEACKQHLFQAYGYDAYMRRPEIMFAPIKQWHRKLDIADILALAMEAKITAQIA